VLLIGGWLFSWYSPSLVVYEQQQGH